MSDSTVVFVILGAVVVLFVSNRVPVAIVALGTALSLYATGVLTLHEALSGFGDPTVLFIAALFVVSEALDSTGVTAWVGQVLIDRAGDDRRRIVVAMMLLCGVLTALITPNASVAALVPVIVIIAIKVGQPTSQLLVPLAFAAHAGALLAMTGSPVSVYVADVAEEAGIGRFGYFEFAFTGVPLMIGTVALAVLLGPRLLPHRNADSLPRDLTDMDDVLRRHYRVDGEDGERLFSRRYGAAEVVIPPRSAAIGTAAYPGMVTDSGQLVVLAVMRGDRRLDGPETRLEAGDTLLVRGSWRALTAQIDEDDDVLAVDAPEMVRRQAVPLGLGAKIALGVLAVMIALLATNAVPPAVAALGAAGVLVLTRVLSMEHVYSSIGWTTVILVAGMMPLSSAMTNTGAAASLADGIVDVVRDTGPYGLLVALFVLTAVLGQLISNMATALIAIPIALSAAAELDIAYAPVLMCVNVAAAAALLTPVATPANLMVMEPGGYRFNDYWKLGLVVMAWYAVVAIALVPLVWSL